jgi:hypothetical protein
MAYHVEPNNSLEGFELSELDVELMHNWAILPHCTRNHLVKVRPDLWRIVARISSRNAIYEHYSEPAED